MHEGQCMKLISATTLQVSELALAMHVPVRMFLLLKDGSWLFEDNHTACFIHSPNCKQGLATGDVDGSGAMA